MQPYVLLGLELQGRGHSVTIATEQRMQGLVTQLGNGRLSFHCISGDPTKMLYEKKYQVGVWFQLHRGRGLLLPGRKRHLA